MLPSSTSSFLSKGGSSAAKYIQRGMPFSWEYHIWRNKSTLPSITQISLNSNHSISLFKRYHPPTTHHPTQNNDYTIWPSLLQRIPTIIQDNPLTTTRYNTTSVASSRVFGHWLSIYSSITATKDLLTQHHNPFSLTIYRHPQSPYSTRKGGDLSFNPGSNGDACKIMILPLKCQEWSPAWRNFVLTCLHLSTKYIFF